ncbi:hypothetical protein [Methyloterricola oryzae]|nr:hypothetical protein [Methyloterricola oryzae]
MGGLNPQFIARLHERLIQLHQFLVEAALFHHGGHQTRRTQKDA